MDPKRIIWVTVLAALLLGGELLAQRHEYCCDDAELEAELERYYNELKYVTDRKAQLETDITRIDADVNMLNKKLTGLDDDILKLENEYSNVIKSLNLEDFENKFVTTENRIDKRSGTPSDARKQFFDFVTSSKAKCLPKYYDRYLVMKQKLEQWEIDFQKKIEDKIPVVEDGKEGKYTVVKGDCLWKIAGKKEIYSYPKYWVKIWEANRDGVISAPPGVKTKIPNPNLIYPGQVLKIPALTDAERKFVTENGKETKKIRKHKKSTNEGSGEKQKETKKKLKKEDKKKDKQEKKKDNKTGAKKDKKDKGRMNKK